MKQIPGYKKAVSEISTKAIKKLKKMFQKRWVDDETLNDGERDYSDFMDDDIYND